MKYFLLALFCFAVAANAQVKKLKDEFGDIEKMKAATESSGVNLQRSMENANRRLDSINMANYNKQNERNLNAFMTEQRERERKQKTQNWIRLGVGVSMLIVLVIGLTRKKKNSSGS